MNSITYRQYTKVSDQDWDWFIEQRPCVQQLWGECMRAEKYGEHFNVVETKLSENSFYEAKKALDGTRFEFKPIQKLTKAGRYKTTGWQVRNLHGAKIKEYWSQNDCLLPQNLGEESKNSYHNNSGNLPQNLRSETQKVWEEEPVALDTTAFDSSLLGSYNLSMNLQMEIENPGVSSFDESLRSTHMAGCEEEKSSVPTKDLEVLQHPLSNEENLGSRSKTNSSSAKTTPNTEPSCSSSQKKRLISTSDDGSVESIRFRSPRDVNRAISPCDPCQRVERSEHGKTPQSDARSHQDAPQASPANQTTQSYFEVELGGVMPQQAWDYGEMECWEDLNDIQLEYRHETVMRLDILTEWLKTNKLSIAPDTLRFLYGLGSEGLLWYTYEVGGVPLDAIRVAYWFVVEGDDLIAYIGKDHPSREIVCNFTTMRVSPSEGIDHES